MVEPLDVKFSRARSLHQEGEVEQAILLYRELINERYSPHVYYLLGIALSANKPEEALRCFERFVSVEPEHLPGRMALGDVLLQLNQPDAAFQHYRKALELDRNCREACIGIGLVYARNKAWDDLDALTEVLSNKYPDDMDVLRMRIHALREKQEFSKAILNCIQFIRDNGESPTLLNWFEEFFPFIRKPETELLELLESLDSPKMIMLTIRTLIRSREIEAAMALYEEKADELMSQLRVNDATMGVILRNEKLIKEAEYYLQRHLEKHSEDFQRLSLYIDTCLALAKAGQHGKFRDAKELAEYWLSCDPDGKESNASMGRLYMAIFRPELSLPYWDKAVDGNAFHPMASARLFNLNYDERLSPEEVYHEHVHWAKGVETKAAPERVRFHTRPEAGRRKRIGYLSPDFGCHPVGYFFLDILKYHDFANHEIYLYSNRFAEEGDDKLSKEFREIVGENRWRWTRGMKPERLVRLIRDDKIDILVEMAGHTAYNRLDVIMRRAAPIQVEWLGYPNTTGLRSMDYRFSDSQTEPPGELDDRSTEKIYRLPNGFHVFQKIDFPDVEPAPCLKNGYITFGSYNNMNKLGSSSIELWSDLLKRVRGSRILLKHGSLSLLDNRESLLSNFAMHGIPRWRIILKKPTPGHVAHLKSYGDMDIALDPIAYNGTTTTCDALSMGVPVLSMPGRTHASRVTSSLLHRVGLGNWIAENREAFLKIGERVAHNFSYLNALRHEIRDSFKNSPLQDGQSMARDLEEAYEQMWQDLCASQKENAFITIESQKE